jgi:hypothetical protein
MPDQLTIRDYCDGLLQCVAILSVRQRKIMNALKQNGVKQQRFDVSQLEMNRAFGKLAKNERLKPFIEDIQNRDATPHALHDSR